MSSGLADAHFASGTDDVDDDVVADFLAAVRDRPHHPAVIHNGVVVQNHFELMGNTYYDKPPAYEKHPEKQPIHLQNHGNPVVYRNIWFAESTSPSPGR